MCKIVVILVFLGCYGMHMHIGKHDWMNLVLIEWLGQKFGVLRFLAGATKPGFYPKSEAFPDNTCLLPGDSQCVDALHVFGCTSCGVGFYGIYFDL